MLTVEHDFILKSERRTHGYWLTLGLMLRFSTSFFKRTTGACMGLELPGPGPGTTGACMGLEQAKTAMQTFRIGPLEQNFKTKTF